MIDPAAFQGSLDRILPARHRQGRDYPDLPEDRANGIRTVALENSVVTQFLCDSCGTWTFTLYKRDLPDTSTLVECQFCATLSWLEEYNDVVEHARDQPDQIPPPWRNFLEECENSRRCAPGSYFKYRRAS